jgi:hypothetical protein
VGAGRRYYPPYAEAFGCELLTASRGVWCVRKLAGFPGKLLLGSSTLLEVRSKGQSFSLTVHAAFRMGY